MSTASLLIRAEAKMSNRLLQHANRGITIGNYLVATLKMVRSGAIYGKSIPDLKLKVVAKMLNEVEEELRKCRQCIEDECIS